MAQRRTARVQSLAGIGVDRMGALAARQEASSIEKPGARDEFDKPLRMENLDTDVPPNPVALEATTKALTSKEDNSYLPFIGQLGLRNAAAAHVSRMTGNIAQYSGEDNCVITAGGLSGILNTLFATVEPGEGVLMTDPTYIGLINRVKLAGAVPVLLPLEFRPGDTWKFPSEKLAQFIESVQEEKGIRISALLLGSPALPSGVYLDREDWQAVADVCNSHDLLLLYDAAFERLLFDDLPVIHPASFPGMVERTITIGSASKELRLIGWRVGWIVGPTWLIPDVQLVGMANVVVPVGIAQKAAQAALENLGVPGGGWSFVLRVGNGNEATSALMEKGIFNTPMDGWGEAHGERLVRFVFSNEPCHRLKGIGVKVRAALRCPPAVTAATPRV